MEQNRNIDFDSSVEIDTLKDAVWRLTNRVYLLEDFIAEKFGEVLGPKGFTKASSSDPDPVPHSTELENPDASLNISPRTRHRRKKRKAGQSIGSDGEEQQSNMKRPFENIEKMQLKNNKECPSENKQSSNVEKDDTDVAVIPKFEMVEMNCGYSDGDDNFLNEKSDDDDPGFKGFMPPLEDEQKLDTSKRGTSRTSEPRDKKVMNHYVDDDGYFYALNKEVKGRKYWRCMQRRVKKCRASLIEDVHTGRVIKGRKNIHSHSPDNADSVRTHYRNSITLVTPISSDNPAERESEFVNIDASANFPMEDAVIFEVQSSDLEINNASDVAPFIMEGPENDSSFLFASQHCQKQEI